MTYCPKCGKYNAWHCSRPDCTPCNENLAKAGGIMQISRWKLWNIFISENTFDFLWKLGWKLHEVFPKFYPYNHLQELLQCPFCGHIMSFEAWEELGMEQVYEEEKSQGLSESNNIK